MSPTIELDDDLYDRVKRRAETNEFESTDEYCQMVLRTVLNEIETDTGDVDGEVETRLEDLGYLS